MAEDFPDSVSCVSSVQAEPSPQFHEYKAPKTRDILLKAAPDCFSILFPRFRCSKLLCRDLPSGEKLWNLPFVFEQDGIPRSGVLAYVSDKHKTWFDPFRSSPQPDRPGGIDFIKLDIVEFRHEFRQFANLLQVAALEELDMSSKRHLNAEQICSKE